MQATSPAGCKNTHKLLTKVMIGGIRGGRRCPCPAQVPRHLRMHASYQQPPSKSKPSSTELTYKSCRRQKGRGSPPLRLQQAMSCRACSMKTMMRPVRAGLLCRPASQKPAQALNAASRVLASADSFLKICAAAFALHACDMCVR